MGVSIHLFFRLKGVFSFSTWGVGGGGPVFLLSEKPNGMGVNIHLFFRFSEALPLLRVAGGATDRCGFADEARQTGTSPPLQRPSAVPVASRGRRGRPSVPRWVEELPTMCGFADRAEHTRREHLLHVQGRHVQPPLGCRKVAAAGRPVG